MGYLDQLTCRVENIMKKTNNLLNCNIATDREASDLRTQTESLYRDINTLESSVRNEINSSCDADTQEPALQIEDEPGPRHGGPGPEPEPDLWCAE